MKGLLFALFCFICTPARLHSQTPFLPLNLNTGGYDYVQGFAEDQAGNYFFVGRQSGPAPDFTSTGYCYKTSATGVLLKRFDWSEVATGNNISLESIHIKNDNVYIVGNKGANTGPYSQFNRLLLFKLDTELNLVGIDTVVVETDSTGIMVTESVMLQDKIIVGTFSIQTNGSGISFLTSFGENGKKDKYFRVTDNLVGDSAIGQSFTLSRMALLEPHRVIVSGVYRKDNQSGGLGYSGLEMDTALNVLKRVVISQIPDLQSLYGVYGQSCKILKTTPNSSYFLGPIINKLPGGTYRLTPGISKINTDSNNFQSSAPIFSGPNMGDPRWVGIKQPMIVNSDKAHITTLVTRDLVSLSQTTPSSLHVTKYDTGLAIKWTQSFQQPNTTFAPFGVYELSNKNIMVLSSAYDFQRTPTTYYDNFAFIIDSNGTPLRTFSLPGPERNATVKVYPNPATDFITFESTVAVTGTYALHSAAGALVQEGRWSSGEPVPVASLPAGIYFYQLLLKGGGTFSGAFSKQ